MWRHLPWTQASEILALLDGDEALTPTLQDPKGYFERLVADGDLERAVSYIGIALPPAEAIRWAWTALKASTPPPRDDWRTHLRDAVAGWIDEPSDDRRRAVWAIATAYEGACAEKLLAGAIFFSGGSIAPDGLAPLPPPPGICGKLAGCAVIAATRGSASADIALHTAITTGTEIAEHGRPGN